MNRRSVLAGLALALAAPALAGPNSALRGPGVAAGSTAPDFALTDIATGELVQLSTICTEKPVVLVFGSFT